MLRKFSVENYRTFNKKLTLDFTKVRNYTHNSECIKDGLLNTSLIVGKNGCGKTNLGFALFDIVCTLTDKGFDPGQKDVAGFLNGFSNKHYATFEYEFQSPSGILKYTYCKTDPDTIVYESLYVEDQLIFLRDGIRGKTNYDGLKSYFAENLRITIQNGPLSVLRYTVNNTMQPDDSALSYILDFASHMLYFKSLGTNSYIGTSKGAENIESYIIQNGLIGNFQKFLHDVADLDMDLSTVKINGMQDIFVQKTKNQLLIFNSVASSGTKSLQLFYYWMKHFTEVKFLYMDEFDAFYHYELSEKILKIICSEEDIQAVLTSHNTSLVNNKLMRPDCYLKLEKGQLNSFSELTDTELRQGHNLEKMYRGGEFDE